MEQVCSCQLSQQCSAKQALERLKLLHAPLLTCHQSLTRQDLPLSLHSAWTPAAELAAAAAAAEGAAVRAVEQNGGWQYCWGVAEAGSWGGQPQRWGGPEGGHKVPCCLSGAWLQVK